MTVPVTLETVLQSAATGFALSLSLIVAIGAQNAFVLRQGLRRERVGTVVAVCAGLDAVLMAAGTAGVGAWLGADPRALRVLAACGAAVLLVYAVLAARRALHPHALCSAASAPPMASAGRAIAATLAVSLPNPHVYLDTVLLVGSVGARQPEGTQVAFVAGAALASAGWFVALGYGARALSGPLGRPGAWRVLEALVAITMATLALRLAATAWD